MSKQGANLLNSRPSPTFFDGQFWVPLSYVEHLEEMVRGEMRAQAEHRGYMATVKKLWDNLPEHMAKASFAQSPDTLRKHALIATGHCDSDASVYSTVRDAVRASMTIRYMAKMAHGYAVTITKENTVICTTPKSQSFKAMGADEFKQSKADVLDYIRGLIGVTE